ncbi:MAG: hypothetical protein WC150_14935 [Bacteroidia bacterium]
MRLKRVLQITGYGTLTTVFTVTLFLVVLEITYRCQLIEFYKPELKALNPLKPIVSGKKILVFGDSFSADQHSYVNLLRDSFPEYDFVNASISGTGIQETSLIAPDRIRAFKPDMVIYQVYVGNDLTDIHKPVNQKLSLSRNIYWWLSDKLFCLRFLNYRLAQYKHNLGMNVEVANVRAIDQFTTESYSQREKLYIKSNAAFISQTVLLAPPMEKVFDKYQQELMQFTNLLHEQNIPLLVVFVPHCTQVNATYRNRFALLGADMKDSLALSTDDYPFYNRIKEKLISYPNVSVVNPLPYLRQNEQENNPLYFANDIHLTPHGQKQLGTHVCQEIKMTGWVKKN